MDLKSKIILIYGPTSSGKSNFALKLSKKIKGEIVNADSMQVYKQLRILTARPSEKDQKKIKHHLFGIIDVRKGFSTGQWLKECIKIINLIRKKQWLIKVADRVQAKSQIYQQQHYSNLSYLI